MDIRLYMDEDSMDQRLVRALEARGMDTPIREQVCKDGFGSGNARSSVTV